MAHNEDPFYVNPTDHYEEENRALKEQLADKELTILVLRGNISVFEKMTEMFSNRLNKLCVLPTSPNVKFSVINDQVNFVLKDIYAYPTMKQFGSADKMSLDAVSTALDALLLQWSEALSWEAMLPSTFSSFPLGISRSRPTFTFKNFQSVYDSSTGKTQETKFVKLLSKFDMRLSSYRANFTILQRNKVHETVLHGFIGTVLTLQLFHLYDCHAAAFRYPICTPASVDYYNDVQYEESVVAYNSRELSTGQQEDVEQDAGGNMLDLGSQRSQYNRKRGRFSR